METPSSSKKRRILPFLLEVVCFVIVGLLLFKFLFFNALVPSGSMEPTIPTNSLVLGSRLSYRHGKIPQYGDIVIFSQGGRYLIKRVVALPGDEIYAQEGFLFRNGTYVEEPYLGSKTGNFGPVTVEENCVYVMGDNRNHSSDSRVFGCVPLSDIKAKALFMYYPYLQKLT